MCKSTDTFHSDSHSSVTPVNDCDSHPCWRWLSQSQRQIAANVTVFEFQILFNHYKFKHNPNSTPE